MLLKQLYTHLPRWNEQKREKEAARKRWEKGRKRWEGWRKKWRHNWVCVRSDVVVAGSLATLIGPDLTHWRPTFSPQVSPRRVLGVNSVHQSLISPRSLGVHHTYFYYSSLRSLPERCQVQPVVWYGSHLKLQSCELYNINWDTSVPIWYLIEYNQFWWRHKLFSSPLKRSFKIR